MHSGYSYVVSFQQSSDKLGLESLRDRPDCCFNGFSQQSFNMVGLESHQHRCWRNVFSRQKIAVALVGQSPYHHALVSEQKTDMVELESRQHRCWSNVFSRQKIALALVGQSPNHHALVSEQKTGMVGLESRQHRYCEPKLGGDDDGFCAHS